MDLRPAPPPSPGGTFAHAGVSEVVRTADDPLSTFAVDVDTASYSFARAFLAAGRTPPPGSVRVEEWINAFRYSYSGPRSGDDAPFAVHLAGGPSPFSHGRHLLRVALQGRRIARRDMKPVHISLLVDVSGSMASEDKLPLAKRAMRALVRNLRPQDTVAIVTYAGASRVALDTTPASNRRAILAAIAALEAGGSTAMSSGMQLAYSRASQSRRLGRVSRVVALSDGDANIGATSHDAILAAIRGYVQEGVTLTTVGFGRGNYNDHLMEQLADAGDGNYHYIDSEAEARKVFGEQLCGTLQVIAKDVKIQVAFNPDVVETYRLIGYDNRAVDDAAFRDDAVDGGEVGAGHSVTALYEVELWSRAPKGDLATVQVRYQGPEGGFTGELKRSFSVAQLRGRFEDLDAETRFAATVALAAEILRGSPYVSHRSLDDAWGYAQEVAKPGAEDRAEFVQNLGRLRRQTLVSWRR